MTGRMRGLTAVVTGAGRGIGRAIALAYAAAGAGVVVAARSEEEIAAVAGEIRDNGGTAWAWPLDVTSDESVTELAERVLADVGPPDVVCHSAGAYHAGKFTSIPLEAFQRLVDVNYLGVVRTTQAFLPAMLERGSGNVIVVASTAGKYGSAYQTPYNASKHAVVGLVRSLGLELGPTGVRINAIAPGFVRTGMLDDATARFGEVLELDHDETESLLLQRVPMRRMLDPSEIAHLAVYLGSPESAGMTGQTITISGGLIVV